MTTEPTIKAPRKRSDLPEKIVEWLTANQAGTPHRIGSAIARSAGAVTAASKYLIAEGVVEVHTAKPLTLKLAGAEVGPLSVPVKAPEGSGSSPKGKAADRLATLAAHKDVAAAAKESGAPIPDYVLAKLTPAKAEKVATARRTRQAPPAVAEVA